jgi:transposase
MAADAGTSSGREEGPMCQSLPVDILAQLTALGAALVERAQEQRARPLTAIEAAVRQAVQAALPGLLGAVVRLATPDLDAALRAHLANQPALYREAQLLRSVPGIGPTNAPWLIVLLHRRAVRTAGRGRTKGLVAYVGLDPHPFESGSSVRRRAAISRMGAAQLRRRLFLSALGGTRGDNPLRHFYLRLVGRGKAKMGGLIAAVRTVLVWAWAVFRAGAPFDPQKVRNAMLRP